MANKKVMAERRERELAEQARQARMKRVKQGIVVAVAAILVAAIAVAIFLPAATDKTYYADITIRDYGTITVLLDDETAPITVRNFVELAESGFYDGLTFHRIMEGFMMQGGDPKGNGTGGNTDANGNEINIKGEFSSNGVKNDISHVRGVISMARSGDQFNDHLYYNTASSQFFIVHEDSTFLDGKYASFGHVVSGIEIVDAVCEDAKPTDNNGTIPAADQPVIESVKIRTE